MDIQAIIDDPGFGLTEGDFKAWPTRGGIERSDKVALLRKAFDEDELHAEMPVYAIGECTLYNKPDGRWASAANRNQGVLVAVHGLAGSLPLLTFMWSKGVFRSKPQSLCIGGFDHWDVETEEITPGYGDVDIQFYDGNVGMCRIGFGYWKGDIASAKRQAQIITRAIERCQAGHGR